MFTNLLNALQDFLKNRNKRIILKIYLFAEYETGQKLPLQSRSYDMERGIAS